MFCIDPFYYVLVKTLNNKTYLSPCCALNYEVKSVDECDINHPKIVKLRESLLNNSDRHCNPECYLVKNKKNLLEKLDLVKKNLEITEKFDFNKFEDALKNKKAVLDYKLKVSVNTDSFCNLKCPSCRPDLIAKRKDYHAIKFKEALLNSNILKTQTIHLNTSNFSDPLYSPYTLQLLKNIKDYNIDDITIYTNGLLLNEKMWKELECIHNKIHTISISVDACTEETYKQIRVNGNFKVLEKNIEFLKSIKNKFRFQLRYNFVLQTKNFYELEDFIKWCINNNGDAVYIFNYLKWYQTDDIVKKEGIYNKENEHYEFYKNEVPKIINKYKDKIFITGHVSTI